MTTWINSQFPRPDFHRQVQRHYGLQDTGLSPRITPRITPREKTNRHRITDTGLPRHRITQEIAPRLLAIGQSLDFELVIDVRVASMLGRGNNEAGIFANHCLVQTSLPGPTRVPEGLPSEHASNAGRRPNSFWPSWPLALVSALIVS